MLDDCGRARWSCALPASLICAIPLLGGVLPALAQQSPPAALRCEILVDRLAGSGSTVAIRGLITADAAPISGSYRLQAVAGAAVNTSQAANFTAAPGLPATVGTVSLGVGGPIDVTLTLTFDGGGASCSRRID